MVLVFIAVLIGLSNVIGFYNFFTATRLKKSQPRYCPHVSVLIPARNEERNIRKCLDSVLAQDYPDFEVIVGDDQSEDNMASIVSSYDSVILLKGKELPAGWVGKSWACHQLAKTATGELLLFLDADVTLEPQALSSAVAMMQEKKVKMLSCFPCQKTKHFGETLVVPIIDWLLLSFIPLDLVYRTSGAAISIAIGQFIIFDRVAYEQIGGHQKVAGKVTEDTELARLMKKSERRIIAVRSKGLVKCQMYHGFKESIQGLSRSFYYGAHMNPILYIASLIGLVALFVIPVLLFITDVNYLYLLIPLLMQRILTSILACQSVFVNLVLLPVHGVLAVVIAINSIYLSLGNKIVWKGRKIINH